MTQQPLPGCEELAVRQPSIGDILALAVEKSAGAEAIEKLVTLQQQLLAKEAEREFNEAMNRVQTELSPVRATLENPETHSKYASYTQLDRVIRPIYTKHGLSLSFSTTDCPISDHVRILCHVSRSGFTRTYQCDICADGKGPKGGAVMTKTHASGAAMSYGMRYLLKMIFNIAVGEDDTDGNETKVDISEELEWIANAKDVDELKKLYFPAYKKAQDARDKNAMQQLLSAKNRRLAEING